MGLWATPLRGLYPLAHHRPLPPAAPSTALDHRPRLRSPTTARAAVPSFRLRSLATALGWVPWLPAAAPGHRSGPLSPVTGCRPGPLFRAAGCGPWPLLWAGSPGCRLRSLAAARAAVPGFRLPSLATALGCGSWLPAAVPGHCSAPLSSATGDRRPATGDRRPRPGVGV
jgi:hypothetical protein